MEGFKIPKRTARIFVDTGDLKGLEMQLILDVPIGVFVEMQNLKSLNADEDSLAKLVEMLSGLVESWNIIDDEGKPTKPDAEGIRKLPVWLILSIVERWIDAQMSPPVPLEMELPNGST